MPKALESLSPCSPREQGNEVKTKQGWSSASHCIANDLNSPCIRASPPSRKNLIQLGIISDYLLSVTLPI